MLDTFLPKIRSFGRCNGIRDVADEWNSGVFRLRSDCQIRLTRKGIVYLQEVSPFLDQLGDYAMRFSLILDRHGEWPKRMFPFQDRACRVDLGTKARAIRNLFF